VGGVVPILTNREPVDEGPGREHCQRRSKLKPEKAVAVHGVSLSRPRTFDARVALGDIASIAVGMGLKRVRKRFDPEDIKRFRDRQRRVEYQPDPMLAGHVQWSTEGDSIDSRSKGSPSISN
jgi:hypothetical protein